MILAYLPGLAARAQRHRDPLKQKDLCLPQQLYLGDNFGLIKKANQARGGRPMKKKILLIGLVVLPALLIAAEADDILGNWIAKESSGWPPEETVFSFRLEGTRLMGTVSDLQGEVAIRDGRIKGDEITFFVIRSFGRRLMYKGTVDLDEIKFTVSEEGGKGQAREFTAKREFQRNQDIPLRIDSEPVRFDSDPRRIQVPRR
jgi:hypothetical protein